MRTLSILLSLLALTGCYSEGLVIENLEGVVVLPEEAATRHLSYQDGTEEDVVDPRLIGPVYLGFYPGVVDGLQPYTHPEMGPMFTTGVPGDTYPYGGTTLGDIRYACFEFLACKVVSGRYVDFDSMVDWFDDTLETPILDAYGEEVTTGDYIRQTCYDLMHYTTDEEIRLTATDDKNDDGLLDEQDLDFVQESDGKFYGEFTIYQMEYVEGMTLWGWMDTPSEVSYQFSTCNPNDGFYENEYSSEFYGGLQYSDLLNFPSFYISTGDWVASKESVFTYGSVDDYAEIHMDFEVTE